jgi:RNA polymerase sigma factor (TIGR02999 family)
VQEGDTRTDGGGEAAAGARQPSGEWPQRRFERYYDDYRQVARAVLSRDSARERLQPTELAHEAAIRLFKLEKMEVSRRTHFLSLSARVMRQVLIDEVRRHRAQKRQAPVLTEWPGAEPEESGANFDLENFDNVLTRLQEADPERAWVVEQRFYAGLTLEEIAETSGKSLSTIKRQWRVARAWLLEEMSRD